jgi:hypothetical protein
MAVLHVYSRRGCHLCEQLLEELLPLVRHRVAVEVRDIDSRADWRREYDKRVPVLEFEGDIVCQFTLDRDALQTILHDIPAPG